MATSRKKADSSISIKALEKHHERRLSRLWPRAPFVLRVTEWKKYPSPLLVVSERGFHEDKTKPVSWGEAGRSVVEPVFASKGMLHQRSHVYGEALTRVRPVLKSVLAEVCDDAGVPLELEQYVGRGAAKFHGNLPLDDEAGCKLSLIFKLSERVKDMDRVELIARRVERFTREEAAYWLSRIVHFGPHAGKWATSGMRIMLGGEAGDEGVSELLAKLQIG